MKTLILPLDVAYLVTTQTVGGYEAGCLAPPYGPFAPFLTNDIPAGHANQGSYYRIGGAEATMT
jgi:hypothetical protein